MNNNFMLIPLAAANKLAVAEIIKCNEITSRYGLILSPTEAQELAETRAKALGNSGRIEFAGGIINKLIMKFCDSPFLFQHNYADTLNDLVETFYYFKNETLDELSDDELIVLMKKFFDQNCRGSMELLQDDCLITDNYAYNDTIRNGISEFFSAYDADFATHETPASIDYPLSSDQMELVGIEYIYSYLQKLYWENQFCKNFTERGIHCLLRGYDDHYQDLLINIFSLVLTNLTGSVLADKKSLRLNIEPEDRFYIHHKMVNLSKEKLDALLQAASTHICKEFNITESLQQEYITATVINLSANLKNALEKNHLETIFISLKEDHPKQVIHYEDGEKMDDELFRSIAEEIRQCRYVSDKIAIIQKEIHSITDLTDILEGTCIFDDEFHEVFQSLGDMELALLLKKLPTHVIHADHHFTENEKEWQKRLKCFLAEIDTARNEGIKVLSEKIRADA